MTDYLQRLLDAAPTSPRTVGTHQPGPRLVPTGRSVSPLFQEDQLPSLGSGFEPLGLDHGAPPSPRAESPPSRADPGPVSSSIRSEPDFAGALESGRLGPAPFEQRAAPVVKPSGLDPEPRADPDPNPIGTPSPSPLPLDDARSLPDPADRPEPHATAAPPVGPPASVTVPAPVAFERESARPAPDPAVDHGPRLASTKVATPPVETDRQAGVLVDFPSSDRQEPGQLAAPVLPEENGAAVLVAPQPRPLPENLSEREPAAESAEPMPPRVEIGRVIVEVAANQNRDSAPKSPPRPLTAESVSQIGPIGDLRAARRLFALRRA